MRVSLAWELTLLAAVCLAGSGCQAIRDSMNYPEAPGNTVSIFGTHYFLNMGHGPEKAWLGTYDKRGDKSIISHVSTRSEFAIYFFTPERRDMSSRNAMLAAARKLERQAGTTNATETWDTGSYLLRKKEAGRRIDRNVQVERLTAVFTGQRPGGARFPQSDESRTEAYVACLNCSQARPERRLYFAAVAVIPTTVPAKESADLMQYFRDMIAGLRLYE